MFRLKTGSLYPYWLIAKMGDRDKPVALLQRDGTFLPLEEAGAYLDDDDGLFWTFHTEEEAQAFCKGHRGRGRPLVNPFRNPGNPHRQYHCLRTEALCLRKKLDHAYPRADSSDPDEVADYAWLERARQAKQAYLKEQSNHEV